MWVAQGIRKFAFMVVVAFMALIALYFEVSDLPNLLAVSPWYSDILWIAFVPADCYAFGKIELQIIRA